MKVLRTEKYGSKGNERMGLLQDEYPESRSRRVKYISEMQGK